MKNVFAILGKEVRTYFVSPMAYFILFMFLGVSGVLFATFYFIPASRYQWPATMQPACFYMGWTLVFFLPATTMRLFAEEKKSGTIELLMTAPVTDIQVVLGKYFANLVLFVIMLSLTFFFPIYVMIYGNPEPGPILSGYLGLLLLGMLILSIGILISSMTSNQIVAAITSFGIIFLLWLIGFASRLPGILGDIFDYLSLMNHFEDFSQGVIGLHHVIYYLSVTVLCVFLTVKSVESAKWR